MINLIVYCIYKVSEINDIDIMIRILEDKGVGLIGYYVHTISYLI